MVGIAVHFPFGRYHATRWGTHVNEAEIDWPPSPWRVLRALLAGALEAAGGADGPTAAARAGLVALTNAPPPGYELPPARQAHTRHYLPLSKRDESAMVLDAFVAFGDERELRIWWEADLPGEQREALTHAVGHVRHLGRSESICEARVLGAAEHPVALSAWPEGAHQTDEPTDPVALLTVAADAEDPIAVLTTDVGAMRTERRTTPSGAQATNYRVLRPRPERPPVTGDDERPTIAVLRIASSARPPLTEAVTLAAGLRAAAQRRFDHGRTGRRSATLSGRAGDVPRSDDHRHAHFLVVEDDRSGRADRLVVWAPEGLGAEEVTTLSNLRRLRLRDIDDALPVGVVGLGTAEGSPIPQLTGPARAWSSVTPFVLPRHQKAGRERDSVEHQVRAELRHRSLPEPTAIEPVRRAWATFARDRPGRREHRAKPAVGLRLTFAEPVLGPLALGANAHFGLGLFVPTVDG